MKNFLLPFLGFILLLTASCESNQPSANGTSTINLKTTQAIISVADSNYVIIQNNEHPVHLSDEELKEIDTLLNTCINDFNVEREKESYFIEWVKTHPREKPNANPFQIDLNQYMLQYQPSINSKGEKEVHIEGLCSSLGQDWKTLNTLSISDGGKCFFNLTINLHLKKYADFGIHSEA